MIAKPFNIKACTLIFFSMFFGTVAAQQDSLVSKNEPTKYMKFYEYRGTNAIDIAVGTSVINGDFEDPLFELFFRVGYVRTLTPHINVNFSYNKFNLAYKDIYNEGFMSFDLNFEYGLFPNKRFSPFIFAGGGLNAANHFTQTSIKIQGGAGLEYIIVEGIGLKLFADYNSVFDDELDGLIAGSSDDSFFRIGFGLNFYFGGQDRIDDMLKDVPTVINSNPILVKN